VPVLGLIRGKRARAAAGYVFAAAATAGLALWLGLTAGWLSLEALPDPDSWMGALLLRQTVRTGVWLHRVGRDASGEGTVIHWSRLVDAIALPFVLALRPFLGLERAITTVGTVFGPVSLGALAASLCWGVRPFVAWTPAPMLIPAAILVSPALMAFGAVGEVFGHHLAVLVCVVMGFAHSARACLDERSGGGHAVGSGLWCGLGMWFSVETAPFALMAFGAVALAWAVDGGALAHRRMQRWAFAFFGAVAFAWLVDPPEAGRAVVEIDRLSLPFVVGALLLGVALQPLSRLRSPGIAARMAALLAAGAAAFGVWLALFPQLIHGVLPATSPAVWEYLWQRDNAARQLASPGFDLAFGFGGIAALALLAVELGGAGHDRRRFWLLCYAGLCTAALPALLLVHLRFAVYGAAAGVAAVAIAASRLRQALGAPAAALSGSLLAIVPAIGLAADALQPQAPAPHGCRIAEAAGWLAGEPGVVLADPRSGPELLWRTPVMTVATPYHRGHAGLARWLRANRAVSDGEAEAALAAARVDFVLLCLQPPGVRPFWVAGLPETAVERWQRGALPDWLREVRRDPASGLVLLRVAHD
jgi:hypothetical protein